MIEIITGLILFTVVIGGLGLPFTATLPLEPGERLCLGTVLGCGFVYLAAWIVYWCSLPLIAFWALPIIAIISTALRWPSVIALFHDDDTRKLAGLWLLVAGWCLGLLALVRSYSGGWWVGDWFEHYQRSLFFLRHLPLDTVFLLQYPLPARPPLANLTVGAFMAITHVNFIQFQIFSTLLASFAFIPAAMLARRFRKMPGGDAAPMLAVLIMLSPLFVENTTFSWTKMPTAFFTLSGLFFFLKTESTPSRSGLLGMSLCLAAALLTHYSAGPYVAILTCVWCWRRRTDWRHEIFWRQILPPLVLTIILLSTWFTWSTWHYGAATFLANPTVSGGAGLSFYGQFAQKSSNLITTIVPHPLRPAEYGAVQPASALSYWRDYFFNIYQTNLLLACGAGGLIALASRIWRQRRRITAFWPGFIVSAVLLNIIVTPGPDHWGTTHICLQPVILISLAWLAAEIPRLGARLKAILIAGLAIDFTLGIALHFWVQHLFFSPDLLATNFAQRVGDLHGSATWNNFVMKCVLHLTFLGDIAPPAILVCSLLAGLLGLAVCLALNKAKPAP